MLQHLKTGSQVLMNSVRAFTSEYSEKIRTITEALPAENKKPGTELSVPAVYIIFKGLFPVIFPCLGKKGFYPVYPLLIGWVSA